ncbi:class I SAM-dependent methyltransferase [Dictyobacter kobayashii]|uniref:Tellurite resistance protein n=1 Tax=Dictyobacter kobayashii TaxID=2014872 RepID=A0A402AXV0_9CHLR|nr:class I SAM-dependent methyltransferase [Dictyobacter kobayashii]GCE23893.1 tellurite resistance protein [Dictyobacter kobayashii]
MRESWDQFYLLTKDKPPSAGLLQAISLLDHIGGEALDLGCGAGRDTRYLLQRGFRVTAVDQEEASLAALTTLSTGKLTLVQAAFEDFSFATYELINAHFALPFIAKEQFTTVFDRLKQSLKPGGIVVGQFFGINDEWNTNTNHLTFFTRAQALAQLEGLRIITFEEEDADGRTTEGSAKHWHIYHIIARKPTSLD